MVVQGSFTCHAWSSGRMATALADSDLRALADVSTPMMKEPSIFDAKSGKYAPNVWCAPPNDGYGVKLLCKICAILH